jgi:PPP family 3-phenylpropionic acid transporter
MNTQITSLRSLQFTYYATTAILLPFLPLYFAHRGYDSAQIGMLMMIGPFVAMFAQPMWGFLSDRYRTVKWIILLLWCLTIASSVGLFAVSGFALSFLFVLLFYFFMLPSVPLLDSISIQSAQQNGMSYASVRIFGSIGFCVIAIVSGFVIPLIGGLDHINYLYWLLWLFPIPILLFTLKDVLGGGPRISVSAIHSLMKEKTFLWYLFMVFVLMIPHRANDALFGLYLHEQGAPDWMVSASWALAALCEAPGFLLAGRLLRRYNELALLGIVALLYTVRWTVYALVHAPLALFFLQASHFLTYGLFWIIAIHYVTRIVPEELRSTGQSLLSAVFLGMAGIVGGYLGGLLQDWIGASGMYGWGAGLSLAAAAMLLATNAAERRRGLS